MKLQVSKCLSDSNGDAWRDELEYYKNRKLSGKQKHNAKWMAIYNDFVAGYESGMTMLNDIEDFLTANLNSKSRYNPHVFTEQGLYMLMTVLKGPLAVKQSKALIRTFKKMKDYILENRE